MGIGFDILKLMFEQGMEETLGKKGKHNPRRKASSYSSETIPVVPGGREVKISRPRACTVDKKQE